MHPILIPSRGRANSSQLMPLIKNSPVNNWRYVVEPQEEQDYLAQMPREHLLVLPESDRGLPYVRHFSLNWVRAQKHSWFWMLDDDIQGFYLASNSKTTKAGIEVALGYAEEFFCKPSVGQIGLEYQQFAWSAKKNFSLNSYCDVCVCINVNATQGINFRPITGVKVDRDFTLQVLAQGYKTVKVQKYAFSCPTNGTNKGGLHEEYAKVNQELKDCQATAALWTEEICQIQKKKSGRYDLKINWRYFKQ